MVVLSQMTPREIYQKNVNSVVLIITKNKDGSKSKGTGAVIGESRVITNAHVVLEEGDQLPEKILIFLREDNINDESDKSYRRGRSGRIIRFDSDLDLALLEVKGSSQSNPSTYQTQRVSWSETRCLRSATPRAGGSGP